ncbi:MAG: hypothetical protein WD770_01175 [Actinomycetota bacterium]
MAGVLAHPGDIHGFVDLFMLTLSVVVPLVIGIVWAGPRVLGMLVRRRASAASGRPPQRPERMPVA